MPRAVPATDVLARVALRIAAVVACLAVVVGQPIAAAASSGWRSDSHCCCPDPTDCHCPDGDNGHDAPNLRRCGNAGEVVSPAMIALVVPAPAPVLLAPRPVAAPLLHVRTIPPERWTELETPPF
jgi:hypothetical protein